jgi:hypothetical protein
MLDLNIFNNPELSLRNREMEIATKTLAERCDEFIVETNGIIHRHTKGVCIIHYVPNDSDLGQFNQCRAEGDKSKDTCTIEVLNELHNSAYALRMANKP